MGDLVITLTDKAGRTFNVDPEFTGIKTVDDIFEKVNFIAHLRHIGDEQFFEISDGRFIKLSEIELIEGPHK